MTAVIRQNDVAGETIATKIIAAEHYQKVILTDDAGATLGSTANPAKVGEDDGKNVALGAVADAAVETDAAGTVSGKLRGIIKLFVSLISGGRLKVDSTGTATVSGSVTADLGTADAGHVEGTAHALGTNADAAITTDADGSISGKIRGLIKLLVDKITVKIDSGQSVSVGTMPTNTTVTGTVDAAEETVVITLPGGCGSVGLQITGTWVGQINFEGSVDGTNFIPVEASNGSATINATDGNDIFILPGGGYVKLRCRMVARTSGEATITFVASVGTSASIPTGSMPAGANIIGKVGIDQSTSNANEVVVKSISAGETLIGLVGASDIIVSVTPVLDTAAYHSGDLLFDSTEIAAAVRTLGGTAILQSVNIIDKADQGVAFTLLFANALTDFGTLNGAPDPDDTEAATVIGTLAVATTDYLDLGVNRVACIRNVGLMLKAVPGATSIWVAAVNGTGTPTFALGDLVFQFGFLRS